MNNPGQEISALQTHTHSICLFPLLYWASGINFTLQKHWKQHNQCWHWGQCDVCLLDTSWRGHLTVDVHLHLHENGQQSPERDADVQIWSHRLGWKVTPHYVSMCAVFVLRQIMQELPWKCKDFCLYARKAAPGTHTCGIDTTGAQLISGLSRKRQNAY